MDAPVLTPQIGEEVLWYQYADRQRTPKRGYVTERSAKGLLTVFYVEPVNGPLRGVVVANVRHIDNPLLKENKSWAVEHGGWDWVPQTDRSKIPASLPPEGSRIARVHGKKPLANGAELAKV